MVHRDAAVKRPVQSRRRPNKVEVVRVPTLAMKEALRLSGGDASRLTIQKDGSVIVR